MNSFINFKKMGVFTLLLTLITGQTHGYDIYYSSTNTAIKVGIGANTTLAGCDYKDWQGYNGSYDYQTQVPVIEYSGWCSGATWKYIDFYVTNSRGQNKKISIPGIADTAGAVYLFMQEDPAVQGNYILYRARTSSCAAFNYGMRYAGGHPPKCDKTGDWTVVASIVPAEYQ